MNLISVSDLIRQSWQIYKNNFKIFISITVWLLPLAIVSSLLQLNENLAPLGFLIAIISIAVSIWVNITLIQAINKIHNGETINVKELARLSTGRMASYLWVVILTGIIVLAGLVILIIPGLILGIYYSLSEQVFVIENVKGYGALKRSMELVKGHWWGMLWRWIGSTVFFGLILAIISVVILVPTRVALPSEPEPGEDSLISVPATDSETVPTLQRCGEGSLLVSCISSFASENFSSSRKYSTFDLITDLYSGVLGIVITPLFTAIGVLLYNSLRKLKGTSPQDQPTVM